MSELIIRLVTAIVLPLSMMLYLAGIVLAKGFWAVFFALCTPYGLYLVTELIMKRINFL
jgi:hypothetical protein